MVAPNLIENPASGSILVQSGGVDVASRPILNFIGATVVDNPGNNSVDITVTGGGGTLDDAYDFGGPGAGRTILVDSGAVELTGSGTVVGGFTVNGSRTIASAAAAVWNEILFDADVSLSGVTNVTTTTGFNMVNMMAPTITDAGTITSIALAATLYISGPPVGSGVTVTSPYAVWIDAGDLRTDGQILMPASSNALPGLSFQADPDTGIRQATLNEIMFITNGTEIVRFTGSNPGNGANYIFTQPINAGGARHGFRYVGANNTGQAAGSEVTDADWDCLGTLQHVAGALAVQRTFVIRPRTYTFNGASTVTVAATLGIQGSPIAGTNATITSSLCLWVQAAGTGTFNTYFGATPSMGAGIGVIGISDAGTNPSANPVAGGILYSNAGAGTWRGSGGTITPFGPAGPHCETCGYDEWTVATLNTVWKSWRFVCGHCGAVYEGGPKDVLGRLPEQHRKKIIRKAMPYEDVLKLVA